MKLKMTRKDLAYKNVVNIGYANLQGILSWFSPIGYNAGVYGWNWDCYNIGKYYIITGYRSFPSGAYMDYDIIRKYNDKRPKTRAAAEKMMISLCDKATKGK